MFSFGCSEPSDQRFERNTGENDTLPGRRIDAFVEAWRNGATAEVAARTESRGRLDR
jgi:hypothetical protein